MSQSGNPFPPPLVLIIDDAAENRLLLSSQLELEGYNILEAADGKEGLDLAAKHDPDIVLLDVMMPGIDGFEVCHRLKENPATTLIPVIMVTALREVEYKIRGIEVGADEFLSRPHIRDELLVRVRTLTRLKRARVNLQKERNNLQLLNDISQSITTHLHLEQMVGEIIKQTQTAVGATKGNIILVDDSGQVSHKFLVRAGSTTEYGEKVAAAVMNEGLGGWLVRNKRGDIVDNISRDKRWITLPDDESGQGSAIGVTLATSKRIIGVLILNHPQTGYFTPEHLSLLETIAASISTAIENAHYFTEINEQRSKLEAIVAQSTDAIITTTEELEISIFNQAAERLFQLDATEIESQPISSVPELTLLIELFDKANGRPHTQEITLRDDKTLYASISPIQGVGYAAVMQDITELKRIEEWNIEQARRKQQEIKEAFSRYMSPKLVDHVLENHPGLMSSRERRRAVIMFADIRDYTRFTSMINHNEVVDRLNEAFTKMTAVVYEFEGTVFELSGDEILVGFNAPFDQPDASIRALLTAVTMQKEFNKLRVDWYEQLGAKVGLGIGIDMGEVVVGNVGSETRMTFRMVGDAVNMAHRLVDIAQDGQIVLSEAINERIIQKGADLIRDLKIEAMEPIKIKGKDKLQQLYITQVKRTPIP